MKENLIQFMSYEFAKDIISLGYDLQQHKEFIISKQILRSGTSIGANVEEAIGGISRKDFYHKMSIAYKEARETAYWLRLLHDNHTLKERVHYERLQSLQTRIDSIKNILAKILLSTKKQNNP